MIESNSPGDFPTTRWSQLPHAVNPGAPRRGLRWPNCAQACWYPIYAFIRRKGNNPEQALDHPEEIRRWKVALAAVEQADAGGDPTAQAQLAFLQKQIEDGLDAAKRDKSVPIAWSTSAWPTRDSATASALSRISNPTASQDAA